MLRWSSRLRRAAAFLLGVHLLQVVLLAASAVCERGMTSGTVEAITGQVAAAMPAHDHAAHGHGHGAHPSGVTTAVPAATPESAPAHHHAPESDGECPMAMACTVTAVAAELPTLETPVVLVTADVVPHVAQVPASLHHAPEPPPPRA